ncbi:hypothetical protein D3C77_589060 [compost metagenome]
MLLAADRVDRNQLGVALVLQARLKARGLGLGQVGAGAVVVGLERCRVDAKQHVALFHVAALTVHPLEHHPGHPRAHLGNAWRQDAPRQLGADGQGLLVHGFDADGGLGGLFFGGRLAVAAGQGQAQQQQGRQGTQTDGA